MPTRYVTGWISRPIVGPNRVLTLRDHLYGWLGAPDPYRRADEPHVSLFGIRLPEQQRDAFEKRLDSFGAAVGSWTGTVDGYRFYPSLKNPMVVSLDVPVPQARVASPVADLVGAFDGVVDSRPTPPHVTLLMGGVRGEELQWAQVDETVRRRLRAVTGEAVSDRTRHTGSSPPEPLVAPAFPVTVGPPEVEWT